MLSHSLPVLAFRVCLLLVAGWLATGCRSTPNQPETASGPASESEAEAAAKRAELAKSRLAQARDLLDQGKHEKARPLLRKIKPPAQEAADASFWIAESYFRQRWYPSARKAFRKYVTNFPISDHLDVAESRLFELAHIYLAGKIRSWFGLVKHRDTGVATLEFLLESFPRGSKAADAQRILANYYYDRQNYPTAIDEYQQLLTRFPNSEWRSHARFRSGLSFVKQVRGAEYDATLIERAREHFKIYAETYPEGPLIREARDWVVRLDETLARKGLLTAQFYKREKRSDAAALYYKEIVRKYPQTRSGAAAARIVGGLKEEPSTSDQASAGQAPAGQAPAGESPSEQVESGQAAGAGSRSTAASRAPETVKSTP